MKLFYFNDRKITAVVYVGAMTRHVDILKPATGQSFDIGDPPSPSHIPYVKVWESCGVLLGWTKENTLPSTGKPV